VHLQTGDYLLIGLTVILILLPSQVANAGDALGRLVDRLRGRQPEE
jgi:hypothetical protein